VANFSWGCVNLVCSFADQSTSAASPLASWFWDFGDGSTSTDRNPGHTFPDAGAYQVKLTVTDLQNVSGSLTDGISPTVFVITATISKTKGKNQINLAWTGPATTTVDIWENSAKVATVANTGHYAITDIGRGSPAGSTVRVCEAGLSNCSAWFTL
jgi:PKD repeat protein